MDFHVDIFCYSLLPQSLKCLLLMGVLYKLKLDFGLFIRYGLEKWVILFILPYALLTNADTLLNVLMNETELKTFDIKIWICFVTV